jgi:hypothetical protein
MQQLHCNRGAVFSARSVLRCYKQDKLENCDGERVSRERVCRQSVKSVKSVSQSVSQSVGELVSEWVSGLDNRWGSVVVSCFCKKLVAEAGDSSGTQRKVIIRHWKLTTSVYIYILTTNLQDNWEATFGALKMAVSSRLLRLRLLSRSEGLLYGRSAAASLPGSGEVTVRAPVGSA